MPSLKKFTLLFAVLCFAPLLMAADVDPAQERHERMEKVGDAVKPLGGMLKGELDFDAALAMASFMTMQEQIDGIGELFPEGSYVEGEKRAAKAVWANRADFDQKMSDFSAALDGAIASNPQDLQSLQPVVKGLIDNCKGCHEDYRTPGD